MQDILLQISGEKEVNWINNVLLARMPGKCNLISSIYLLGCATTFSAGDIFYNYTMAFDIFSITWYLTGKFKKTRFTFTKLYNVFFGITYILFVLYLRLV